MAKKEEKKEKKKPIFEKVGLVFRSPVRADILRQLSTRPQRPVDLSEELDIEKQNLNYHIKALKKGGFIKVQQKIIAPSDSRIEDLPDMRGVRVNGETDNGKIQVSYGLELTKNGKNIVNQFIDPLYEEVEQKDREEKEKKITKKEE